VASLIHLDTHVVVWLAAGGAGLSERARNALEEAGEVHCSPMVRLEMQYLFELGRITHPASEIHDLLSATIGLRVSDAPFFAVAREAERQTWTRDPFDRLIVAQAAIESAPLLTKDESMRAAYPRAVW
jgi:PIN domain nuclease of toxin-antitoxin system